MPLLSRRLLGCLLALTTVAAAPPPALAPYIHGGTFDPGDYGWMRGRVADASEDQRRQDAAIRTWLTGCMAQARSEVRRALTRLGATPTALAPAPYGDALCRDVAAASIEYRWPSFDAFRRDLAVARPLADTFLWATALAVDKGGPRGSDLGQKLLARPLGEQMLRSGLFWGEGDVAGAPPLTPGVRAIVVSRLTLATGRSDHANTAWLAGIVARNGWPKQSVVGEHAADAAWLTVQHADNDPAFQLRVLRLMEPLLATGEVSRKNHAYLYDRVMLKIVGRQRYATQFTCAAGARVPLPLEDAAAVDRRRAEAGLAPLADYRSEMDRLFGPCPR